MFGCPSIKLDRFSVTIRSLEDFVEIKSWTHETHDKAANVCGRPGADEESRTSFKGDSEALNERLLSFE